MKEIYIKQGKHRWHTTVFLVLVQVGCMTAKKKKHSQRYKPFRNPQAPVVQTLDSAIHRINHYPADKYYGNQLRDPLDRDLSCG